MEGMKCDVCGKSLEYINADGSTCSVQGMNISIQISNGIMKAGEAERIMYPYEPNRGYIVCYPCWLKSLGIKPDNK